MQKLAHLYAFPPSLFSYDPFDIAPSIIIILPLPMKFAMIAKRERRVRVLSASVKRKVVGEDVEN